MSLLHLPMRIKTCLHVSDRLGVVLEQYRLYAKAASRTPPRSKMTARIVMFIYLLSCSQLYHRPKKSFKGVDIPHYVMV